MNKIKLTFEVPDIVGENFPDIKDRINKILKCYTTEKDTNLELLEKIEQIVCNEFDIENLRNTSKSREQDVVTARFVVYYIVKHLRLGLYVSYKTLSLRYNTDRASIYYGVKCINTNKYPTEVQTTIDRILSRVLEEI
jgi:hypothetical protein